MPISCDNCRENLALLIPSKSGADSSAFLGTTQRSELESHVASCAGCTRELALLRAAVLEVQNLPTAIAPASLRASISAQIEDIQRAENRRTNLWQNLFRPSRAVWAGGSFALAAFAIFLLRNEPMMVPDAYAPSAPRSPAITDDSTLREAAVPENTTNAAADKAEKTAVQSAPRVGREFTAKPQAAQVPRVAQSPANMADENTPDLRRTFPVPQREARKDEARESAALPPDARPLPSSNPPSLPQSLPAPRKSTLSRFARLEILPVSSEAASAQDNTNANSADASASTISRVPVSPDVRPREESAIAAGGFAAPSPQMAPQQEPSGARGPAGAPGIAAQESLEGESVNNDAATQAQIADDGARMKTSPPMEMRAAPPVMSARNGVNVGAGGEKITNAKKPKPDLRRDNSAHQKIEHRARLTLLPPRHVPHAQIRVWLPPALEFFAGRNSRIIWHGAARKNQAIQADFNFLTSDGFKSGGSQGIRVALETADGTQMAVQTVVITIR